MRLHDAVRQLSAEPASADLARDAYLGRDADLRELPRTQLRARLGPLGAAAPQVPAVVSLMRRRLERSNPGRMFSLLARKQG
jgi:hypothetical protein